MFNKERIDSLERALSELKLNLRSQIKAEIPETVECEKCGCLLKKETAFKGEGEIRKRPASLSAQQLYYAQLGFLTPPPEDYVYYPYYCKIHKPKTKVVV